MINNIVKRTYLKAGDTKKKMNDIKINTPLMKIQYFISWIGFILGGLGFAWLVALILVRFGKTTSRDEPKKKEILNLTYQKFIFVFGIICIYLSLLSVLFREWIIPLAFLVIVYWLFTLGEKEEKNKNNAWLSWLRIFS